VIYICIPALNEARTVGVLLWRIRRVMDEFPRDYHVLVLDDGSTDDTPEVLAPYARVLPLTVLRNERPTGYAAALEKLIREAVHRSTHPKRDVVITLQADFTESPDDIPHFIKKLEGGADVVGSVVAGTEGELPRSLRWSRKGLPWLVGRARLPKELGDPLSGFRAYRVAVLRRALQDRDGRPLLTRGGWAANAELLLSVSPHVRRAEGVEVSLRYTRRQRETRFRPWGTALELWDLVRRAPRRPAAAAAVEAAPPAPAPGPKPAHGHKPPTGPRPPQAPKPAPAIRAAAPQPQAEEGVEGEAAPAAGPKRRRSRSRRGPRKQPPPAGEAG
jgi:glycosyltransferase involved in cell wall biosynthesis